MNPRLIMSMVKPCHSCPDGETDRQRETETDRETERNRERQRDRDTNTQSDTQKHRETQTWKGPRILDFLVFNIDRIEPSGKNTVMLQWEKWPTYFLDENSEN